MTLWTRIGAFLAAMSVAAQAHSEPLACAPREEVLTQLSNKFQEAPIAIGLANNGGLLELLSTWDGATWTIIITMPNGPTCLVAAGESWQDHPPEVWPGHEEKL